MERGPTNDFGRGRGEERRRAKSAGLLLYRTHHGLLQLLLAHPGGPFWATKDLGSWTIPKGETDPSEDPLETAKREFREETGFPPPEGPYVPLGEIRQASGKRVLAWAVRGDCDAASVRSNTFTIEWPPRSGALREYPEIDRVEWFDLEEARRRIQPAQREFVAALARVAATK